MEPKMDPWTLKWFQNVAKSGPEALLEPNMDPKMDPGTPKWIQNVSKSGQSRVCIGRVSGHHCQRLTLLETAAEVPARDAGVVGPPLALGPLSLGWRGGWPRRAGPPCGSSPPRARAGALLVELRTDLVRGQTELRGQPRPLLLPLLDAVHLEASFGAVQSDSNS